MRKSLLVLVFLFTITLLSACNQNVQTTSNSSDSILNTFEAGAINVEKKYLQSHSDEDLKELCDQLTVLPWNDEQLRQMVLKYYPIFFEKFDPSQSEGIAGPFNPYYEMYVFAYKAEGGELIPVYNEYKEKADNLYEYARTVYGWILGLDNITAEEYNFLYDEAYRLYSAAKENVKVYPTVDENKAVFLNMLQGFGCICEIREAMGKEIDSDAREEMKKYMDNYKEIMDRFR